MRLGSCEVAAAGGRVAAEGAWESRSRVFLAGLEDELFLGWQRRLCAGVRRKRKSETTRNSRRTS